MRVCYAGYGLNKCCIPELLIDYLFVLFAPKTVHLQKLVQSMMNPVCTSLTQSKQVVTISSVVHADVFYLTCTSFSTGYECYVMCILLSY